MRGTFDAGDRMTGPIHQMFGSLEPGSCGRAAGQAESSCRRRDDRSGMCGDVVNLGTNRIGHGHRQVGVKHDEPLAGLSRACMSIEIPAWIARHFSTR